MRRIGVSWICGATDWRTCPCSACTPTRALAPTCRCIVTRVGGRSVTSSGATRSLKCATRRIGCAEETLPDEPHSTGGSPSGPGVLYWLNVRRPAEGRTLLGWPRAESQGLLASLHKLPHRHFHATQHTKSLFKELFRWHDSPVSPTRTLRLRLTVTRLLLEVSEASGRRPKSQSSEGIREIIRLIRSHPERDFRLDDLARHARLSLSHFKKRFRTETGLSPRQFILRDKIEAAKRILHERATSVTDIALDLGFVSSQYFATVFKRITGITPSRYRDRRDLPQPSQRGDDGQS
jgi:AraC-like DNA-binding protein